MEEGVSRTNQFFGGLNPHVYRTFLTHGEMDPRRNLGPQENINKNSEVIVMSRKLLINNPLCHNYN